RTVAPAGGNTCGPRSVRLDLKAPVVPRPDRDHTGPFISLASMARSEERRVGAGRRFRGWAKRTGKPCRGAAMPNGRCKLHGGKSTGPRTPEGLERSRRANWKHGHFSREAKAERSRLRAAILALRDLCDAI